jgi:hypothetical protein
MKSGKLVANFYEATPKDIDNIYNKGYSFQVSDLFVDSKNAKLIEIPEISVGIDCRRLGFASELLRQLCKDKEDTIIIAGAGALISEYPEEPSKEQYNELFENLTKFYTSNNFEDVTQLFGTYDGSTKRTFLYLNEAGKKAIEDRKSFIEIHK